MRLLYKSICSFARFKVPYNINIQQNATYLKKIERSQQIIIESESQATKLLPRRKRRIYDRPRIDRNLQEYGAWRIFDPQQLIRKFNQHAMAVQLKLSIAPKWLVHAFGIGMLSESNPRSSHREYYFQDNQLNSYLLYEYRNTTHFKQNESDQFYQSQQKLHSKMRKIKRLSPQQFWKSQQKFQFRVNTSIHAQKFKFEAWILKQIQARKSGKSYDEYIDQKYGALCTFNQKSHAQRFEPNKPMVKMVTPEHYNPSTKKNKKVEESKVQLANQLDQKYRIKERLTVSKSGISSQKLQQNSNQQ